MSVKARLAAAILLACSPSLPASDPEVERIQQTIARLDGAGGYYAKTYRQEETAYWSRLPGWMREEARGKRVALILDIGCGYGTLLALSTRIFGARGYCLDAAGYIHPELASEYGLTAARGNIELGEIPWDLRFDAAILTEVLEHFNFQPLPTLRKICRALAPRGILYLSTPDQKEWGRELRFYRRLQDLPAPDPAAPVRDGHIWIYSEKELKGLLKQAGFSIERFDYSPGVSARHFNVKARKR